MEALQSSNKRILFNLLPAHVANHFLDNQFRNNLVRGLDTVRALTKTLTKENGHLNQD